MSEEKPFNLIDAWYNFTLLRRDLEAKVKELEITSFSLQYGAKSEAEFRQKLREARILLEKIEELVGEQKKSSVVIP